MKKLILFSIIMMFSSFLFAENKNSFYVVCAEWEGYTNSDGTGAYWEVIKKVFSSTGIKVKTKVYPWSRAEKMVKGKKADAIVGDYYYKEKDGKDFLYPKWHISVEDSLTIFYKKGTLKNLDKKGISSLKGKRVGWIRGYDFDKTLLNGINVKKKELSKIIQGLKMVTKGRIDVFLDYKTTITSEAKKSGFKIDKNKYGLEIIKPGNKLFVVFSNSERLKRIIKIFDTRMTQLAKSGEIDKIFIKWGLGSDKFGKDRFGKK